MSDRRVFIMRGLPGAGKSTYVAEHFPDATVCRADDYFMRDGVYQFDPDFRSVAHWACWKKFQAAILAGHPLVVVDNTNTRLTEIAPYVMPAEAEGYEVEIIQVLVPPEISFARQVHAVPVDAYRRQRNALEYEWSLPPWWKWRNVYPEEGVERAGVVARET